MHKKLNTANTASVKSDAGSSPGNLGMNKSSQPAMFAKNIHLHLLIAVITLLGFVVVLISYSNSWSHFGGCSASRGSVAWIPRNPAVAGSLFPVVKEQFACLQIGQRVKERFLGADLHL